MLKNTCNPFFVILLFNLFYNVQGIYSEELLPGNNVGIYGGAGLNMHSPTMSPIFSTPAQIKTTFNNSAFTFGSVFGVEGNLQIHKNIAVGTRLGFDFCGTNFEQQVNTNTTNALDLSLTYFTIQPLVKILNIIPYIDNLYFTTGVNIGIPISASYNFENVVRQNTRVAIGNIDSSATRVAIPIGIGYLLNVTDKINIVPEISFNIGLNNVSSAINWSDWNFNQLRAGVSVLYSLPDFFKKDTVDSKEKDIFEVEIEGVYTYSKDNKLIPVPSIHLEEAEFGEYFPLLPYIFYDVNDTELKTEYMTKTDTTVSATGGEIITTNVDTLSNAMSINNHILDIIAVRLQENPNATLTISGHIDSKFETDISIAKNRADGVKYYLAKKNIDTNRLIVKYGKLPEKPSAQSVREGIIENRRVELSSNSAAIFEPYFVKGEKTQIATPNTLIFIPKVKSNKAITAWDMEILQADRIARTFQSNTETDAINDFKYEFVDETEDNTNNSDTLITAIDPIRWNIHPNEIYPSQLPIEYKFSAYTTDSVQSYIGHINLYYSVSSHKKTIDEPDKIISKYSLVLFDFDSPQITENNRATLDKLIIPNIKFGSIVDIYGYSDKIGQKDYNINLSKARANAVKDYILTKNRNVQINTYGLGSESEIFDNTVPVGRQLSRTVQVYIINNK